MATGKLIQPEDLDLPYPENLRKGAAGAEPAAPPGARPRSSRCRSRRRATISSAALIVGALLRARGNVSAAAESLEVSRPTLHDLMKKHGIDPETYRSAERRNDMMRAAFLASRRSLCLAALAGCADDDVAYARRLRYDTRRRFQDGVSPSASYHGTADAVLKNDPDAATAERQLRNGSLRHARLRLLSTAFYERRLIIKMDISSITTAPR